MGGPMAADANDGSGKAFALLHPKVKEVIWKMGWTSLRPIQVEAIHQVLEGNGDIIISARTASGKTEAAFLPIISQIVERPSPGIRAIYAGPLKALINDQFLRLERICEKSEIPVHKWHGDVPQAAKKKLLEKPAGILLITPESLESVFVNHSQRLSSVFGNLSYFVIDELHSFLESERGAHLKSLMSRLEMKTTNRVRRFGLSATIGELDLARQWLRPLAPEQVSLITSDEKKTVKLRVLGYQTLAPPKGVNAQSGDDEDEEEPNSSMLDDISTMYRGKSALIFANRKREIEKAADYARREAERQKIPNTFRVHHGSLSKGEREETEDALRSTSKIATFCSSTLEM